MSDYIPDASIEEESLDPTSNPTGIFEFSSNSATESYIRIKAGRTFIGLVPIGVILPWHKDLSGTPELPIGWMECNGQVCNDSESPYNGQTIPNLNGDATGANSPGLSRKEKMFVRGGTVSGTGQDHAFQGHRHSFQNPLMGRFGSADEILIGNVNADYLSGTMDPITDGVNGTPQTASETRPANMSIVWIIRIK